MKQISDELYEKLDVLGLIPNDVNASNVGGSNYAKHLIQPWVIWRDWSLNPWDADIVKRALRTKDGDSRKMDYEKIIHICRARIRQIEMEEKYGIKNYQERFNENYIKEGESYVCIKDWVEDCGDRMEIIFNDGQIYNAPKDGFLQKYNGELHPVTPIQMKEYFERIKE